MPLSWLGDKISYASNQYEALEGSDALVIITEWSVFRSPDFEKIANLLNEKVIFDGRNLFSLEKMESLEFKYISVGRRIIK